MQPLDTEQPSAVDAERLRSTDEMRPAPTHEKRWHPLAIVLLPIILIIGCWNADFVGYDDPMHVAENAQVQEPLSRLLEQRDEYPYYPVTLLTYKLDYLVFSTWMPASLGSWAPGVRSMTLAYHAAVALLIWRILLLVGLSAGQALFIALVFAIHPLASETVCWTSERKNAVSALLGFSAVWVWLRWENKPVAVIAATVLYGLALLAKQSVLGLLPLFVAIELFGGRRGLSGESPIYWVPGRQWLGIFLKTFFLVVLSVAMIRFTVRIMTFSIVPPPGGSLVTALLTDLEILCRYLGNLVLPVNLSAVYSVDPVRSWQDSRVFLYGSILLLALFVSVWYAANRRRAIFGWLWLVGSLGPNLNLIAISHLMQDRYLYLGTPGMFLVIVELWNGIGPRFSSAVSGKIAWTRLTQVAAASFILMLAALSYSRGSVWLSSRTIFEDATRKEPAASFARYGLGETYRELSYIYKIRFEKLSTAPQPDAYRTGLAKKGMDAYHVEWLRQWQLGIDRCPDLYRYTKYLVMALDLGIEFMKLGRKDAAEKYLRVCVKPPTETSDDPRIRVIGLSYLVSLLIEQNRPAEAYEQTQVVNLPHDESVRLLRARAALSLLEHRPRPIGDAENARLLTEVRTALNSIAPSSDMFPAALALLKHPLLSAP